MGVKGGWVLRVKGGNLSMLATLGIFIVILNIFSTNCFFHHSNADLIIRNESILSDFPFGKDA
jgi:hypothetical protein